jgi:hypothetical protein
MTSHKTVDYTVKPNAMLVGLADSEAELCKKLMPIDLTRVGHTRAALERMLVTRPLVVVARDTIASDEQSALRERAEDIGAELILLVEGEPVDNLKARLADVVRRAWKRRLG